MSQFPRVARNYAKAMGALTSSQILELKCFLEIYQGSSEFKRFIEAPQVSRVQKENLIQNTFKSYFQEKSLDVLMFLLKNRRLSSLSSILQEIDGLKAQIITAIPLPEKMLKSIAKDLIYEHIIDPSIIGGYVLKVGNKVLDASIKNSLSLLKKQLGTMPCH